MENMGLEKAHHIPCGDTYVCMNLGCFFFEKEQVLLYLYEIVGCADREMVWELYSWRYAISHSQ